MTDPISKARANFPDRNWIAAGLDAIADDASGEGLCDFDRRIIRRASAMLAFAADARPAWQGIERAPRDETSLDLWVSNATDSWRVVNAWWCPGAQAWIISSDYFDECIEVEAEGVRATHWMPLSASPDPAPRVDTTLGHEGVGS